MTHFKKKKRFEDATLYRITYTMLDGTEKSKTVKQKEFNSTKSLEQFVSRNDEIFGFVLHHKWALVCDEWIRYTIIGNRTLLIEEIRAILFNLDDDSVYEAYDEGSKYSKNKK